MPLERFSIAYSNGIPTDQPQLGSRSLYKVREGNVGATISFNPKSGLDAHYARGVARRRPRQRQGAAPRDRADHRRRDPVSGRAHRLPGAVHRRAGARGGRLTLDDLAVTARCAWTSRPVEVRRRQRHERRHDLLRPTRGARWPSGSSKPETYDREIEHPNGEKRMTVTIRPLNGGRPRRVQRDPPLERRGRREAEGVAPPRPDADSSPSSARRLVDARHAADPDDDRAARPARLRPALRARVVRQPGSQTTRSTGRAASSL
jgi:hypothetical protein